MLTVTDNQVRVETRTLTAILDNGLVTSLVRKSDNKELIRAKAGDALPLQLIYGKDELVGLDCSLGGRVTCRRYNDHLGEVRIESWHGDGVIVIQEDTDTGDLVIEPSGYASRPGLRSCRWTLAGIADDLELIAPLWQGVRLPLEDPLIHKTFWRWPQAWEAGLAILHGRDGGVWVHCQDTHYRHKNLQIGGADSVRCLGFDTESYGPLEGSLAAGGLAWRVNVYTGDWQVPAHQYRQWLERAYRLDNRDYPEWLHDLRLAISWCPAEPAILDALAKRMDPKRVLLHLPNWRTDGYDENYPTFQPSDSARAFIAKGKQMGFHVMPHFNAIDMDPSHPTYAFVRDFQYRDLVTRRVMGWSWRDGKVLGVPESNAARMQHRSDKVMIKVHPGLAMWRSILAESVQQPVRALSLDIVFLDVSHNTFNLANCFVENMTSTEGMKRLLAHIAAIDGLVAVAGEGRNEIVATEEAVTQVHLFNSSGRANVAGLERTGKCALNEFLFGKWCRSFGYSWLGGGTPEERLRMQLHVDLGCIPTLTIHSAGEIEQPNEAVATMLKRASE